MRIRTLILLAFWAAVLGYGAYGGMLVISSYLQTSDVVEQAFSDVSTRQRASGQTDVATSEYASEVRGAILTSAKRAGLPIEPRELRVSPDGATLRVSVRWSCPVLIYNGETWLSMPMWLDRVFDIQMGRRRSFF